MGASGDDGTFFVLHKAPWNLDGANMPEDAPASPPTPQPPPTDAATATSQGASDAATCAAAAAAPAVDVPDAATQPVATDLAGASTASLQTAAAPLTVAAAQPSHQVPVSVPAWVPATADTLVAPDVLPKDFIPCPESSHALYHVDTEHFIGPLDLLLFLIRRHEVDIFNIPIAFICARYLEYLDLMENLSIDVASEFMYMASELLHIKSRMLLPKPEVAEEEEEGDPRAELVRRLLEYQKYQAAAEALAERDRLGRDVFARPPEPLPAAGPAPLRDVNIFALVHAFNAVLKRQKPEIRHRVIVEQVSVKKRMQVLVSALAMATAVSFHDLLGSAREKLDLIVTFLAVLELTRLKLVRLAEAEGGQLVVQPRFSGPSQAMQCIDGVEEQFAG